MYEEILNTFRATPSADIATLFADLDHELVVTSLPPMTAIQMKRCDHRGPGRFLVEISDSLSAVKQRFAAAHALGHIQLHGDKIGTTLVENVVYQPTDGTPLTDVDHRQAMSFAVVLLVDNEQLRAAINAAKDAGVGLTSAELAKTFGVETSVIDWRLGSLRLTLPQAEPIDV